MGLRRLNGVARLRGELESAFVGLRRRAEVVAPVRQTPKRGQRVDLQLGVRGRCLEQPVEQLSALPDEASLLEPPPDRSDGPDSEAGLAGPKRPRRGGT